MNPALKRFLTAAKKVEKAVADLNVGGYSESGTEAHKRIFNLIGKLEDRLSDPVIRGDVEARNVAFKEADRVRELAVPALEAYRSRRISFLDAKATSLAREARVSAPLYGSYEHELLIRRGR